MFDTDTQDRIRHQAYLLWLEDGCPHGRDEVHWHQAEQIVRGLDAVGAEAEMAGKSRDAKAD